MTAENETKKLTEEQKATVMAWVEDRVRYRQIVEMMAKPAPEGFGVKVSLGTLSNWIKTWRQEELFRALKDDSKQAAEVLESAKTGVDFGKATIRILQQRLFKVAAGSGSERTQVEMLRMLLEHEARMRRQELAEKNYELARERFEESKRQWEFDISREVMKHWHALSKIDATPKIDDQSKIWLAREKVFVGPNGEKCPVFGEAGNGKDEGGIPSESGLRRAQADEVNSDLRLRNADCSKARGANGGNGSNPQMAQIFTDSGVKDEGGRMRDEIAEKPRSADAGNGNHPQKTQIFTDSKRKDPAQESAENLENKPETKKGNGI